MNREGPWSHFESFLTTDAGRLWQRQTVIYQEMADQLVVHLSERASPVAGSSRGWKVLLLA